ncbi:hypothetical protein J6590_024097 [Homalodisca vitripennis]|nr:hypothetical protein J6590_024097 [Homalodisca vitripennis]
MVKDKIKPGIAHNKQSCPLVKKYKDTAARDHGIRGYNHYREFCNMSRARDFGDLESDMLPGLVDTLRGVYAHVDDIDLFPGGMSERPLPGGVLGPTFACIVGHQFRRVRSCDRFWSVYSVTS